MKIIWRKPTLLYFGPSVYKDNMEVTPERYIIPKISIRLFFLKSKKNLHIFGKNNGFRSNVKYELLRIQILSVKWLTVKKTEIKTAMQQNIA